MESITANQIHNTLVYNTSQLLPEPYDSTEESTSNKCAWCKSNTTMTNSPTCKRLYCIAGYAYITTENMNEQYNQ